MADPVIEVEHVSKKYLIRHQQIDDYVTLREQITDRVKSWRQRLRLPGQGQPSKSTLAQEEFWALKDVSFTRLES